MANLPSNVEILKGSYYYRKQVDGKRQRRYLCRVADGEYALHQALALVLKPAAETVNDMLDLYVSTGMADLAPKSRKAYMTWIKTLRTVFGEMAPADVKPAHIAQFLERRKQMGRAVTGNREFAVLSSAYQYAMRMGTVQDTPFSRKIKRNPEKPSQRYVRDEELAAFMERVNPSFRDFLEVAYLTGLRSGELRELRRDEVYAKRIIIEESKTGKQVIIAITSELRKVLDRAMRRCESPYVLTNTRGEKWTESALQNYLMRHRPGFTLHNVRAKAESDSENGLGLLSLYKRQRRITAIK